MDFYKRKERSIQIIKRMLNKGATKKQIEMALLENGGLGKKIIEEYLSSYEELIQENNEGIYSWKTIEN